MFLELNAAGMLWDLHKPYVKCSQTSKFLVTVVLREHAKLKLLAGLYPFMQCMQVWTLSFSFSKLIPFLHFSLHLVLYLNCNDGTVLSFSTVWLLTVHVHMTLATTARLANGLMAFTNGTSCSQPCTRPFSHSSGDIVINMNPETNVKKMDTVVKLDPVSLSMMSYKIYIK